MPVHFRQIASQCGGQYQGDIGYGRTVTELFRTVSSHKITGYQSGGKRNIQPGPYPQHGTDGYQLPHLIGEQIKDTTHPKDGQTDLQQQEVVHFLCQLTRQQDKRNNKK